MALPQRKIYSVSEITHQIRGQLEAGFPNVTIEGEVSNFRPSSTGHYYFSLKDREAVISVVMFKSRTRFIKLEIKDGMLVRASGSVSVYARRGTYQLIVESIQEAGEGAILAMLEERKKRLAAEGLFDSDRKRPLPLLPSRVAVVTSPTEAALRDVLRVLKRRNSGVNLLILPAPVQGDEAAPRIAQQIRVANTHKLADVLIVGRGGGSLEDLLPFSEEIVARAVAESQIPVISAVGHEIDTSLSDLAADVRAPTPSAAAEIVSGSREELLRRTAELENTIRQSLKQRLERIRLILERFSPENLNRNFRLLTQPYLLRYDDARESLAQNMRDRLTAARHAMELAARELEAHSPLAILERGFAVVTHRPSGSILRSSRPVAPGDTIDVRLFSGRLAADVKEKKDEIV